MNASTLCEGLVSMRRLKSKLDGKLDSSDSDAMRFGRAVHCRLLEPERFPTAFPQSEQCTAYLKGVKNGDLKRCRSRGRYMSAEGWLCGTHAGPDDYEPADYITADEAERIERIRENAFSHREIQHIRQYGGAEVSIVFDLAGVRCKARLDKWIPDGGGFIVDVKTISKPLTDNVWSKTILDFAYHVKAAWYCEAVKATTGLVPEFIWVAIETTEPYDVAAIRLTDFDRQVGRWECLRLVESYKACLSSGVWPGAYPEMVQHVGIPAWKAKEYSHIEVSE